MSKRKHRQDNLLNVLKDYSNSRTIDLKMFSDIHCRLTDDFTILDVWPTTGKYFVLKTSYFEMGGKGVVEKGGEKGLVPFGKDRIFDYLDNIFFAVELSNN